MYQYDRSESFPDGGFHRMRSFLGIDVGKGDFHAALIVGDRTASKSFPNNKAGLTQLASWLKNRKVDEVHACLESTGGFEEALSLDLHERGHIVSVANPSRIKAFAQSELLRTKTDAVDAALIARFCKAHVPDPWEPLRRKSAPCKRLYAVTQAYKTCFKLKPIASAPHASTAPLNDRCANI
jgi:transposase